MPKIDPLSLGDEQIVSTLTPFQIRPSTEQCAKIREYIRLLLKWNQSVSLTSITDPAEILARHFGESLFVCSLLPVENCRLADVGSGSGFPGLALKIASPGLSAVLIEANKKKCAFLSEVARVLELTNVEIVPMRFNDIRGDQNFANMVTCRALGGFTKLLRWARSVLSSRGHVVLWIGGEDSTSVSATPGWIWQPAIRIPESQRRFVLIGRPIPEEDLHSRVRM
jgi:16S rRNA (guanine527-N7)-methyltransferase